MNSDNLKVSKGGLFNLKEKIISLYEEEKIKLKISGQSLKLCSENSKQELSKDLIDGVVDVTAQVTK